MYTTVGGGRKRGQSVIEEGKGGNEEMRVGGGVVGRDFSVKKGGGEGVFQIQ
jgi:hypothetical protein